MNGSTRQGREGFLATAENIVRASAAARLAAGFALRAQPYQSSATITEQIHKSINVTASVNRYDTGATNSGARKSRH